MRLARMGFVLFAGALLALDVTGLAQAKPEEKAQRSDKAWLALTDTGKYAESWKAASAAFQAGVSEEKWESALQQVRSPLGKVETRKLKGAAYSKTLPGAPEGAYVVIQYETSFEHKQAAVETVTASLEKDGAWRVVGYFIK
jgi:hypothetical protein